jgi:hypothetical protein
MLSETWVGSGILETLKLDTGYGGQNPEPDRQQWPF